MDRINDKLEELVLAILESPEYQELQKVEAEVISTPGLTEQIKEFCWKNYELQNSEEEDLYELLRHALESPKGFGNQQIVISEEQIRAIARFANGDGRTALNTLEMAVINSQLDREGTIHVTDETLVECTNRRSLLYDKKGEEHYNLISALHKSMRNSDPDAAVYWMNRMLDGGENPLYIARRLIRFASEDVGMADSRALQVP